MRWGRTAVLAAATAVSAGAAALVAGRVVSDFSVRPRGTAPAAGGGLRVHSLAAGQVELTRSWETQRPGRYALEYTSGHAVVGEVLSTTAQTVVRRLESTAGEALAVGQTVRITPQVLTGDPRSAVGLEFSEIHVRGELGPMPAWYLPGVRDLCVIAVHGIGADRRQALPLLPMLDRLKVPVLVVTYRNDEDAPRSPDGIAHFGETEWRDVEAAIRLAVDGGARRILLYGWSVGATMALRAAARSDHREAVRGLVLDSPVLDWEDTVRRQATRRGVPGPLAGLGVRAAQGRSAVDPAGFDRLALGADLTVPALLLHSADDTVAAVGPARELARRREDLVVYEEYAGAEHEALWNADPERYQATLLRFLTPLL
jgi:pimeloyl-ACP methyl ester carboxylesterase